MALLSQSERDLLVVLLNGPNTASQRESLLRELKADDESVEETSVDSKMGHVRKQ